MSSICREFYKPQTLDGKIYPENEIKASIHKSGEGKKTIGNFTIYLHEANICLLKVNTGKKANQINEIKEQHDEV